MTVLSICIPTRNRAELLEYCLENVREFEQYGIEHEIVVVDHASHDRTPDVIAAAKAANPRIRSHRQAHEVGWEKQVVTTLRQAKGDFCVYLADDDKLIYDKLAQHVRYLQKNPDVTGLFTDWWAYDDEKGEKLHGYFPVLTQRQFNPEQHLELFNYVTVNCVFPEIGIYRRDALQSFYSTRQNAPYWAFTLLHALSLQGTVMFAPEPFYYEVAVTKTKFPTPSRVNREITTSYLDNLRAGLEQYALRVLTKSNVAGAQDQNRVMIQEILNQYACQRLVVAFKRALKLKQLVEVSEYAQRIMLWRFNFRDDIVQISHAIYVGAGAQAAADLFAGASWLRKFYLVGFKKPEEIVSLIRTRYPEWPEDAIEIANAKQVLGESDKENLFVLVLKDTDRELFVKAGLLPGNVVALESMAKFHQILPAQLDLGMI